MKNAALSTFFLGAALLGSAAAAPAGRLEAVDARDLVTKEVVVTQYVTVTLQPGETAPTGQPANAPAAAPQHTSTAQAPAQQPQPSQAPAQEQPSLQAPAPAPPAPKPTTAPAPAPPAPKPSTPSTSSGSGGSGSSGAASNSCPNFPGMSNPLPGASESYCCTESSPCGTPQAAGAEASFYSMAGGTGACGTSLPDSAMFVAVDATIMGSLSSGNPMNPLCGKTVVVKNTVTGKTATGTVADKCPGCHTNFGIDLSPGVFQQLATEAQGVFPVQWWFTDL